MNKMYRYAASSVFFCFIFASQDVLADGIVNAGFIYSPSAEELANRVEEISLHLVKEGGFSAYRVESDPPGLICDENCTEAVERLPAGSISLKIIGEKPFPLMKIPLRGKWTEGCDGAGDYEAESCVMNLHAGNSKVVVEADPKVQAGTLISHPSLGEVMFISADMARGYAVVANHLALSPPLRFLAFNPRDPLRDAALKLKNWDGSANTEQLARMHSEAAVYCKTVVAGPRGNWHLPSQTELAPMNADALKKIQGITQDYLWTSTPTSFSAKKDTVELLVSALSTSSASMSTNRSSYSCNKTTFECSENYEKRRYQALCVTRIPF